MASTNTGIAWCDKTWSPLVGCAKVSAGCKHCYAETMGKRLRAMALADIAAGRDPGRKEHYLRAVDERGRWTGEFVLVPEALRDPLRWRRPARIFVNPMSDLFGEGVPFEFIMQVFYAMHATPQHTYMILTKRPARAAEFFADLTLSGRYLSSKTWRTGDSRDGDRVMLLAQDRTWPLPNVWLGVSVEDQATADERIPHLLRCPASVRWVSYEPALGPVDFDMLRCETHDREFIGHGHAAWGDYCTECAADGWTGELSHGHWFGVDDGISWIVVGGESGAGARPFNVAWARDTVRQCREEGVACFVKQLGAQPVGEWGARRLPIFDERRHHWVLGDPKGGDPEEWPEDLRVREFPSVSP